MVREVLERVTLPHSVFDLTHLRFVVEFVFYILYLFVFEFYSCIRATDSPLARLFSPRLCIVKEITNNNRNNKYGIKRMTIKCVVLAHSRAAISPHLQETTPSCTQQPTPFRAHWNHCLRSKHRRPQMQTYIITRANTASALV